MEAAPCPDLSADIRAAMFLSFAMTQILALPEHAHDRSPRGPVVRVACLEAMLMNVRLVAGFLVKNPNKLDWHATSFVERWHPPHTPDAKRLAKHWKLASQQVAHLSRKRTPDEPIDSADTSLGGLRSIAEDCHSVMTKFIEQLTDASIAGYFSSYIQTRRRVNEPSVPS